MTFKKGNPKQPIKSVFSMFLLPLPPSRDRKPKSHQGPANAYEPPGHHGAWLSGECSTPALLAPIRVSGCLACSPKLSFLFLPKYVSGASTAVQICIQVRELKAPTSNLKSFLQIWLDIQSHSYFCSLCVLLSNSKIRICNSSFLWVTRFHGSQTSGAHKPFKSICIPTERNTTLVFSKVTKKYKTNQSFFVLVKRCSEPIKLHLYKFTDDCVVFTNTYYKAGQH